MAAPYENMGYSLVGYCGTAGQTPATQLTNATDMDYDVATDKGETTSRGTGGNPPIKTENVTKRNVTITFTMNDDPDEAQLTTLLGAKGAGTPISFKLVVGGTASTLFQGDCIVDAKYNAPLSGPATWDFTLVPTKQAGVVPTVN